MQIIKAPQQGLFYFTWYGHKKTGVKPVYLCPKEDLAYGPPPVA